MQISSLPMGWPGSKKGPTQSNPAQWKITQANPTNPLGLWMNDEFQLNRHKSSIWIRVKLLDTGWEIGIGEEMRGRGGLALKGCWTRLCEFCQLDCQNERCCVDWIVSGLRVTWVRYNSLAPEKTHSGSTEMAGIDNRVIAQDGSIGYPFRWRPSSQSLLTFH